MSSSLPNQTNADDHAVRVCESCRSWTAHGVTLATLESWGWLIEYEHGLGELPVFYCPECI